MPSFWLMGRRQGCLSKAETYLKDQIVGICGEREDIEVGNHTGSDRNKERLFTKQVEYNVF